MESPQRIADDSHAIPRSDRRGAPTFSLIARQPLGPGTILLAIVAAAVSLGGIVYTMNHSRTHRTPGDSDSMRSAGSASGEDKDDDPNQIDTIVLGDLTDAPVPARRGDHVSSVHPTILIVLPHSGDHFGQIPNSPAGHLLYAWLAAFNQASPPALDKALPTFAQASATDIQMQLRRQTGGFTLLSSREPQPGVIVFRLRDQTKAANEVLGTLLMNPDSAPPAIASFSLRAVSIPAHDSTTGAAPR